jgi:hypothetical protein
MSLFRVLYKIQYNFATLYTLIEELQLGKNPERTEKEILLSNGSLLSKDVTEF